MAIQTPAQRSAPDIRAKLQKASDSSIDFTPAERKNFQKPELELIASCNSKDSKSLSDAARSCRQLAQVIHKRFGLQDPRYELALQRSCAIAPDPGQASDSLQPKPCVDLARYYEQFGSLTSALAVYLEAPGCVASVKDPMCLKNAAGIARWLGYREVENEADAQLCQKFSLADYCQKLPQPNQQPTTPKSR